MLQYIYYVTTQLYGIQAVIIISSCPQEGE
jgi:hypothetical protein